MADPNTKKDPINKNNNNNEKKTEKEPKKEPKAPPVREKGRGTVKSVISGDTIVVIQLEKNQRGPPPERVITLTNLEAPRFVSRKEEKEKSKKEKKKEEPFAWQSREFLRKKVIGKPVSFTIENKTPNKEYGLVWLGNEQQNLGEIIVAEGWARVRQPKGGKEGGIRPELQTLLDLEEEAKKGERGVFTKKDSLLEVAQRVLPNSIPSDIFEKLKGKVQAAVIEHVRTGSSLRVTILPHFYEANIMLSGVECPMVSKEGAEPFGREAKFFTEHFLLNRDVSLIIEGMDKFNLFGTVSYNGQNISEELLKNGLAKYVDWSGQKTNFAEKLKAAEQAAKQKKLRIWASYVEPKALSRQEEKKQIKPGKEILGTVVDVIHGGFIKVVDASKNDHKFYLASVRVPNAPRQPAKKESQREAADRTWAWEAKEYLRKRLIGQRVRCVIEYTRPQEEREPRKGPQDNSDRIFCSVYVDKNNVAVELLDRGFASVQPHQGGELRSKDYEHMVFAEERARKTSKGVWSNPANAPLIRINDLSIAEVKEVKQFLGFLKRAGRQKGVVETEFSGSRVKLYVPKENCQIVFSLSGIKCPPSAEDLGKTARDFVREKCHQRDVEFEVLSFVDKSESFVGNMWINKENVAVQLLEQGLATTIRASLRENEFANDYFAAEEAAKKMKRNVWVNYDEEKEKEAAREKAEQRENKKTQQQELVDVLVTEIIDGTNFFVQIVGPDAEKLEELMKGLAAEELGTPHTPQVNEFVKAQFTADDAWYRAQVKSVTPEGNFHVLYIDYGNEETIPSSRIRKLSSTFNIDTLAAQAKLASLAYIKAPGLDQEYGREAASFLKEMVWGKPMLANVEWKDNTTGVYHLNLLDRESQTHVNAAILRAGLAKVEKVRGKHLQGIIEKLKEQEDKARAAHVFIWEYGDPGSDEEEERPRGGLRKGKN